MWGKFARHLKSNAVGYIALFVAMSGTAYAATTIGSPQVINNSLKSIDLKNGKAVGGIDVIDNSLSGRDISESDVNLSRVAARARSTAAQQTTGTTPVPIPLSGASFTQSANGTLTEILVHVRYDESDCPPSDTKFLLLTVKIDDVPQAQMKLPLNFVGSAEHEQTRAFTLAPVFESGVATTHTVSAEISESPDCTSKDFNVDFVNINVVEVR